MKHQGSDLKKKLMESLPDEMDNELFKQLQSEINKTVNEYDDNGAERAHDHADENEDPNTNTNLNVNDSKNAGVTAGAESNEPGGSFDDADASEFTYDRIMSDMADVQMPPELEERLQKINADYIAACEARAELENRKHKRARRMKRIRSVAAVIVVFAVISGGILWKAPQAEAFRLKLYDTVFSPTHEDVGVEFVDTVYNNMPVIEDEALKAKANDIIQRDGFILYPGILPEGYEVSEIEQFDDTEKIKIIFSNRNENYKINMIYYPYAEIIRYNDTEKSKNLNVLVNGQDAIIRKSDKNNEIYWKMDNINVRLTFSDNSTNDNTLIEMAEGIKSYYYIK